MKRFMLGLTTIVALVAMTLLGLTAPAAHADDSVPYGTPNPAVVLNPDVVSGYPGDLITVNVLQNDLGPNLALVGYRNLQGPAALMNGSAWLVNGQGVWVATNRPGPGWLTLSVDGNATGPITLDYLVNSNGDTSVVYVKSLTVNVNQYQQLKVKRVKGQKGRFDIFNPNPNDSNCTSSNCGAWLMFGHTALYRLKPQQHTIIKVKKQYYKYLTSHKKIPLVVLFNRGGGSHQLRGTFKYPMGKKAYKQYKKAHKKHHHTSSS